MGDPNKIIKIIEGRALPDGENDVNTDIIAPSESMKRIDWDETAKWLYYGRRHNKDGSLKNHVLNDPRYNGANHFLAGSNFGCGSSREDAPQAILRSGYRAVIAVDYAGIFADNCLAIGLVAVCASRENLAKMLEISRGNPDATFKLDLEQRVVHVNGQPMPIVISDGNRDAFLTGSWEELDKLQANIGGVEDLLRKNPTLVVPRPN